jgi:hypothetical protein
MGPFSHISGSVPLISPSNSDTRSNGLEVCVKRDRGDDLASAVGFGDPTTTTSTSSSSSRSGSARLKSERVSRRVPPVVRAAVVVELTKNRLDEAVRLEQKVSGKRPVWRRVRANARVQSGKGRRTYGTATALLVHPRSSRVSRPTLPSREAKSTHPAVEFRAPGCSLPADRPRGTEG